MRARLATLAAALLVCGALIPAAASIAHAQTPQETTDKGKAKEGQSGADAKKDGEATPAAPEEGPPWTYQMARMGLAILFFLALGMGLLYYRFVVVRQRGEV